MDTSNITIYYTFIKRELGVSLVYNYIYLDIVISGRRTFAFLAPVRRGSSTVAHCTNLKEVHSIENRQKLKKAGKRA